jgi:hypothetical protein
MTTLPYPDGFDVDHYLESEQVPTLTVGVDWLPDHAQVDEGATPEDLAALEASFQNYDPDKPTFLEVEQQRTDQARARWLASQLAGKTPEQAYVLIDNALTGATTVAEMRQVLIQLLPIIGAGLVYLVRSLEE